jgi:hypothetical protein
MRTGERKRPEMREARKVLGILYGRDPQIFPL